MNILAAIRNFFRPFDDAVAQPETAPVPQLRRGRPKGSKNRPQTIDRAPFAELTQTGKTPAELQKSLRYAQKKYPRRSYHLTETPTGTEVTRVLSHTHATCGHRHGKKFATLQRGDHFVYPGNISNARVLVDRNAGDYPGRNFEAFQISPKTVGIRRT